MSNYNYIILAALAFFPLAACNKEMSLDEPAKGNGPVYETVGVKVATETKVTLAGGGASSQFEAGDRIAVWTEAGNFQTCTVNGSYEISVDISGGVRSKYAVYYNGATAPTFDGSMLSITLPASYDYAEVSGTKNPVPMVAKNVSGNAADMTFYAVGALARITVTGIPATADNLVVTFDKDVTGEFTVTDPGTTVPHISTSAATTKNVLTINLVANTDYTGAVINIPVPTAASLTVSSVVAKAGDTTLGAASFTTAFGTWVPQRAYGRARTAAFTPSMASMVLAPGNLYTDGTTLKMAADCFSHVFSYSGNMDNYKASAYTYADRTHFNWSEIYYLMKGLTPSAENSINSSVSSGFSEVTNSTIPGGNEKAWRVPSFMDMDNILYAGSATSGSGAVLPYNYASLSGRITRPGSTFNGNYGYRFVKVLVTGMEANEGTTDYDPEISATSIKTTEGVGPTTTSQAGIVVFPDNVSITLDGVNFVSPNGSTHFVNNRISKTELVSLLEQGCAFLPSSGDIYTGNTKATPGITACYATSEPVYGTVYKLYLTIGGFAYDQVNKTMSFLPVRLVRDSY